MIFSRCSGRIQQATDRPPQGLQRLAKAGGDGTYRGSWDKLVGFSVASSLPQEVRIHVFGNQILGFSVRPSLQRGDGRLEGYMDWLAAGLRLSVHEGAWSGV